MRTVLIRLRTALVRLGFAIGRRRPVRPRLVLATSHSLQLTGNLRAIADELARRDPAVPVVTLASRVTAGLPGLVAGIVDALLAGYHLATARLFVVDDYFFPMYVIRPRRGTARVQTWHAAGAFKKVGYSVLDKSFGADESLVSQVLAFSRDIRVNPQPTDLAVIIARAIEMASPKLDAHHVVWEVEGPAEMPVTIDPLMMEQALLNLILNAAEAMAERGGALRIFYSAGEEVEARQLRLTVRDAGTGIPAGVLEKIFDPFFTTKDTGTGLGLAFVHRIVEAHDGTIIANNPPGGGAQFEIRI